MGQLSSMSQPSFAAGEIAPALYGRTDLAKYRVGASQLRNFFVMPYGGAATRPGTAIVGRCKQQGGAPPRNIPFQFNTLQTYILEFGGTYMRVIKDGGYVLEAAKALVSVTNANPGVFEFTAHGWLAGDQIFISGAFGMTQINSTPGYQYIVDTVPNANHVTFKDLDGNVVDTTAFGVYSGSGVGARVYTLTTPYGVADLPLLKYVQSADVMTLTHPSYAPRNLTRTGHAAWTLTAITFAAAVQVPASLAGVAVPGGGTALDYYYVATAIVDATAEESVPTAATKVINDALNQTTGVNNTMTLTVPGSGPSPDRYSIYRSKAIASGQPAPTVFGYIGQTTNLKFVDANFDPDFSQGPPAHANPFASSNNPSCSTYNEGRQVFAAPTNFPQTMYFTQPDNFTNMDVHSPVRDDDAITVTLTSRQVNAIKHLVSTTVLIALTSGGAWQVTAGSQSDAITPTAIQAKPQSFNGCGDVPPLTIGPDILYVQERGAKVRDLAYNFYINLYAGNDLSVLSNHLFYGFQVQEWTYCEEPNYQILAVRNDGAMLAFTYLKEQDVYAWSKYDSLGNSGTDSYRSVASIPEGQEDAAYMIVQRTIPGVNGGLAVYYQERQASRNFYVSGVPDVKRAWAVDAGVRYVATASQQILTGLQHLEGATVSLLVDGSTQEPREVVNGTVTMDEAVDVGTLCLVGLGYECELKTLRMDMGEPSVQGKRKKVSRLNMIVQDTRGLQISPARQKANGDIVFDQYVEVKERSTQNYGAPIQLRTGIESLLIKPQWQVDGMLALKQAYPLPATVLALIPWIVVGDDGG
jgi:hypothetical protein